MTEDLVFKSCPESLGITTDAIEAGSGSVEAEFTCSNCGSHRRAKGEVNTNFSDKQAGCNWKTTILECADCGANQAELEAKGKEDFSVTPEMLEKLKGI